MISVEIDTNQPRRGTRIELVKQKIADFYNAEKFHNGRCPQKIFGSRKRTLSWKKKKKIVADCYPALEVVVTNWAPVIGWWVWVWFLGLSSLRACGFGSGSLAGV